MVWNRRCWDRAVLGELEAAALADCNEAVRLDPNVAAIVDSRAFTYLKMRQWDSAIADYDSALRHDPKMATSLYGRGLARVNKGDRSGRNADIAAAKAIKPAIAEEFAHYGVQ